MRTKRRWHLAALWVLLFGAAGALAASGMVVPLDRAVSAWLRPLGLAAPILNLVWVVGGAPLTGLTVLAGSVWRQQWRWIGLFVAGLLLEVLAKHVIVTPLPQATPEPLWLARLENLANPSPHGVARTLRHWLKWAPAAGTVEGYFGGSFFSGHVFRITFTTAFIARGYRRWYPRAAALAAGVLVVALGGHWAIDAAGGYFLAEALVALA